MKSTLKSYSSGRLTNISASNCQPKIHLNSVFKCSSPAKPFKKHFPFYLGYVIWVAKGDKLFLNSAKCLCQKAKFVVFRWKFKVMYQAFKSSSPFGACGMRFDLLEAFGLDPGIIAILKEKYGPELLPIQEKAFKEHHILSGGNFIIFAVTSAGKTLVGEILSLQCGQGKARLLPGSHQGPGRGKVRAVQ